MLKLAQEREALKVIADQIGAPTGADLLAEVPVQLTARGLGEIEVRAQVVRVEQRERTWVLGMRLAGGGDAGEHDEYLALWLTQMVGAAEQRPRRVPDPVVGRSPVRAGGAPLVRVLTAAAMVATGVALLPAGSSAGSSSSRLPASVLLSRTCRTLPPSSTSRTDRSTISEHRSPHKSASSTTTAPSSCSRCSQ